MKKVLFALSLFLLPSATFFAGQPTLPIPIAPVAVYNLSVTFPSSGVADMAWDPIFGGADPYRVTVEDLTTSQTVSSFYTYNTTATVSGLTTGHTVRFTVQKGGDIIITEIIAY